MKGCLNVALVGVVILALLGLGAFKLFQSFTAAVDNFPDDARQDAVYAEYGPLVERVCYRRQ